jgi:1-acyl-sn-glycerol-3-phosphate acyltransferase
MAMAFEAPSDADLVLREVVSVVTDLHGGVPRSVALDSDVAEELGLDSLAVVELHDRLEDAFGVTLSEDVLATAATPGDWLRAVLLARGSRGQADALLPRPPSIARPAGEAWPAEAETLTEALAWHVEKHPDLVSIRILGSPGRTSIEDLSYGALWDDAAAVARGLVTEGLGGGERVALMLPTGREYFVSFLGALLAGGVPVPLYPPVSPSLLDEHLSHQAHLLENAAASVLIADSEVEESGDPLRRLVSSLRTIRTSEALGQAGGRLRPLPRVAASDTALIQYTSGSTSDPKGVVLTHAQVLANIRSLGDAVEVSTDDVFVSWLPLYHDMGLIGAWHASLFFGFPLALLSPLQFLARPVVWLEAIASNAGTLSAAPNFAYQSCVDRISDEELDGLDLSTWRLAINGSEPVSALTIDRFADRFERSGFRRQAMSPAYGLAEVGVGLTLTPLGRGPMIDTVQRGPLQHAGRVVRTVPGDTEGIAFVGCGMATPGYQVRVCDTDGNRLPDLREGRIQCQGPSATAGYFGNGTASRALWTDGWLETGDLGYLREGELFVTGRAKDLIIRGGRNIHPEDLEQALGQLDGVSPEGAAVFACADPDRGTEGMVVVVETALEDPAARERLRLLVGRQSVDVLGAAPDQIVLASIGSILRTPSLKIRRAATREAFEAGRLTPSGAALAFRVPDVTPRHRRPWDRRLPKAMASWAFTVYAWSLVALIGLPLWVAVQLPLGRRLRWRLTQAGGRSLVVLTGIDLRVNGALSPDGPPAVVVANHSSFVDALALALALPESAVFVTSSDMEHQRFIGSFLRRLGCVFVHRGRAGRSEEDVQTMVDLIRAGHHVVVFPEGSIPPTPGVRPFHLGAFAVARATGCPVIPVGIRGTRTIVPPGTRRPHRGVAEVTVGPPIVPTGDGFIGEVDLGHRARRAVGELSRQAEIDR